jgi:hypothetical protein
MYERENDAASIDQLAAGINAAAASVAALVEERERSARQLRSLARYSVIENAAPEEKTDAARAARDVQIAAPDGRAAHGNPLGRGRASAPRVRASRRGGQPRVALVVTTRNELADLWLPWCVARKVVMT